MSLIPAQQFLAAWVAYICIPSSKEWWQFGFLSFVMALAAVVGFLRTLALIAQYLKRDRQVAAYANQGPDPKGDQLASSSAQQQAGMLD